MSIDHGTGAMLCAHCKRPMAQAVWLNGWPYHLECTRGPGYQTHYQMDFKDGGCTSLAMLTEQDVRRIVREELAERNKE